MVTSDNLRVFLRSFPISRHLQEEDISAWISRFDRNVDGGLTFSDMAAAL